jgi:hypothetical protein
MAKERNKDSAMAAYLVRNGFPHGKRKTSPRPNSGGTTMVRPATGSSNFQKLQASKAAKAR